jgi:carboxymethylenebutenolidase
LRRALFSALAIALLSTVATVAHAEWTRGQFQSDGKPVEEHHCVPTGEGPFPAVIILHGSGPRDFGTDDYETMCSKFADSGYYAEFIEYYSQTDAVSPGDLDGMHRNYPIWLNEIHSGVAALKKNPTVNAGQVGKIGKIGLIGFSLGSYLAVDYGATYPDEVSAIVEYYGGLSPELHSRAAMLPPVLIIHGDIDRIVPVQQARDLDAALTKAGRPHEMKIYPGAEHAFNFPAALMWYKPGDTNDAWDRGIKFFDKYLKNEPK